MRNHVIWTLFTWGNGPSFVLLLKSHAFCNRIESFCNHSTERRGLQAT